jgi:hypothetical protein
MAPWTFNVMFPYDTQFTFGALMFAAGEDRNLKLLTLGPAPERFTPVYGQAPSSGHLIHIRRCLLRSEPLCIDISSHHQDRSENPDRGIHPSAIDWSIELFLIDIISWSRFSWWLTRDRGKYLLELRRAGLPYHHGGPSRSTSTQHL